MFCVFCPGACCFSYRRDRKLHPGTGCFSVPLRDGLYTSRQDFSNKMSQQELFQVSSQYPQGQPSKYSLHISKIIYREREAAQMAPCQMTVFELAPCHLGRLVLSGAGGRGGGVIICIYSPTEIICIQNDLWTATRQT